MEYANYLMRQDNRSEEYLLFGSWLCCVMADSASWKSITHHRELAKSSSTLLIMSVETCEHYFHHFNENQGSEVEEYNLTHRIGVNFIGNPLENGLSGGQRTGQIFPGRSICRSGLKFGAAAACENSKTSRKSYKE